MSKIRVKFNNPIKATEFVNHFGIIGLPAEVVLEDNTVVVNVKDSKSLNFIRQMIEDIREDSRADKYIGHFVVLMRECAGLERAVKLDLIDGSAVMVESKFARRFLELYERINDESRRNLSFVAVENEQSHKKVLRFVMNQQ